MTDNYSIIIPARYNSARLPGKLLKKISGKTVLEHTYRKAKASSASRVIVAVDDKRLLNAMRNIGAEAIMTSPDHESGSSRLAECVDQLNIDCDQVVVNLQGDEPFMLPLLIDQIAGDLLAQPNADVSSLYEKITDRSELMDPSVIKVVMDKDGFALYFSRAPIPWVSGLYAEGDGFTFPSDIYFKRVGMYAYRASYLRRHSAGITMSNLESAEKLEQLRMLDNGARIHMALACATMPHPGINTQDDLSRAQQYYENKGSF